LVEVVGVSLPKLEIPRYAWLSMLAISIIIYTIGVVKGKTDCTGASH
jgi:hypothetical protein